jgi:predicted transposase/invertase (TIGR01784 family)
MKDRLDPLNDYMFLKVMGEKGDEEQMCAFLNAVLGRKGKDAIESVEIIENKTVSAEVIGDKSSVLDARARTAEGERTNIEIQMRNAGNMERRSLFYWSREFSRGMEAGQDYRDASCVIAINVTDYEFLPEIPAFHTSFHIREDRYRDIILTDALEIHFVDMVKFRRMREKDILGDPLQRWLAWLDRKSPEKLVEEVVGMDTAIRRAEKKMAYVSSDKEALRAYQMREMALSDWTSGLNYAREEGIREGMERGVREGMEKGVREGMEKGVREGMEKGVWEIARNLKKIGIPVDQIVRGTGLSIEDIAKL